MTTMIQPHPPQKMEFNTCKQGKGHYLEIHRVKNSIVRPGLPLLEL